MHEVDAVPQWMSERFIFTAYRPPQQSFTVSLKSVFVVHNETGNIWTHFIPGCFFAWVLFAAVEHVLVLPHHHVTKSDATAAVVYLAGSTAYHFMSSIAHTFAAHSFTVRELMYRLDYASISLYGFACGVTVTQLSTFVLPPAVFPYVDWLLAAGALLTCWLASVSRRWGPWQYAFRTVLYLVYWLVCNVGLLHRLFVPSPQQPLGGYWTTHMVLFFGAAVLNATKFPESVWPGRFDVVGHSHQLFHLLSSLGTYMQLLALEQDQDLYIHDADSLASYRQPMVVLLLAVAVFVGTVCVAVLDHRVAMRRVHHPKME